MALSEKTLTPAGVFIGADGNTYDSAQYAEDLRDAIDALEVAITLPEVAPVAARLISVGPIAAKDNDIVHALFDGITAFPGPFTNPLSPRNLTVTFSASWDGGDVTVVGTDQFDEEVSETFEDVAATTVAGVKIFKTVTSATKETPAGVAGAGASIGTGDKIGLLVHIDDEVGQLQVALTPEAVVLDATYHAFTPDTLPSATTYILLANINLASQ